jgi:WD40 repeat protein
MRRMAMLVVLGLVLVFTSTSMAGVPLGGLAVALSPAEDSLVAAGDNRVLYVLNLDKLDVINRVWLGTCIVKLEFNKDGSLLLAEDSAGTLFLIDVKTWQVTKKLPKSEKMSAARSANLIAVLNPDYNGQTINMLNMTDLSEQGKIAFPKGRKVAALGLDADGGRLGVLMESVNDDSEPKTAAPADLKGLPLDEFKLKNDGKTSRFMVFKVPGGERLWEHKTFFSAGITGAKVLFQGENAMVVNYSNLNAQISPNGEITLFKLDNSFNYGLGFSPDQTILMSGGLSEGTYTKVGDLSMTQFKPDRMQGWPEYFKNFAVSGDGTSYGSTSGYRIIKIKPGGTFEKSVPVF